MKRSCFWWLLSALIVVLAAPPEAWSQRINRASNIGSLTRRPSERAPSAQIGGANTRGRSGGSIAGQPTSLLGRRDFDFQLGTVSPYVQALTRQQLGLRGGMRGPAGALSVAGRRNRGYSMVAGLTAAPSLSQPLPGVSRTGYVPPLESSLYTPRPETTRFQDLLGVQPELPESTYEEGEGPSMPQRLLEIVDERTHANLEEGLRLFKAATRTPRRVDPQTGMKSYPDCPDCPDLLRTATYQLARVRDLQVDPFEDGVYPEGAHIAPLLLAHAMLEREEPTRAMMNILAAFRRNPAYFDAAPEPLSPYFGDADGEGSESRYMQSQLRRYLGIGAGGAGIGKLNPRSPEALALEAYCAWRLGDLARARETAARASALVREAEQESEGKWIHPSLAEFVRHIESLQ